MKKLVLDIDHTLVHCLSAEYFFDEASPDFKFNLGMNFYYGFQRPYLIEFLDYAFEHFDVSLCTAASLVYAKAIARELGIDGKISHIISKEDLKEENVVYNNKTLFTFVKEISDSIVIDDKPYLIKGTNNQVIQASQYCHDHLTDKECLEWIEILKKI